MAAHQIFYQQIYSYLFIDGQYSSLLLSHHPLQNLQIHIHTVYIQCGSPSTVLSMLDTLPQPCVEQLQPTKMQPAASAMECNSNHSVVTTANQQ